MIRVVLDTNIVVSAFLQPLGAPAHLFMLSLSGPIQLCVSAAIYAEYEEILSRPRFGLAEDVIRRGLAAIRERGLWVRLRARASVCGPRRRYFLGMRDGR